MENTSLYHSGTKGMRWGVRKYQNKDGSLTPAGKKRYAKAGASNSKGADKNKPKAAVKAKTKTAETKPKELTPEEKKAKVLESRSAKELYENRKLFDYDEMNKAHKLLALDKQVKDLVVHEPNKVEKFFDSTVLPWTKRINEFTTNATDAISKVDKFLTQIDPEAKARKAATADAAVKKAKSEAAKANAEAELTRAEKAKVDAETRKVNAEARTAEADAKRAESRGKYYRSVKKSSESAPKDDTPDTKSSESEAKIDTSSKASSPKTYKAVFGKYYTSTKKASASDNDNKPSLTEDDSVSGDWLGKDSSSRSSLNKKTPTTYYDVDYVDHTPSKQTTSLVSSHSSTSVALLPAPSNHAKSFVSGLLSSSTSSATVNRIQSLESAGNTVAQIADKLDISTSTVSKYLKDTD